MTDTLAHLTDVFRDVFDDDTLVITPQTTASDIENWDSLMHVTLIVKVEKTFHVRFSSSDVAGLQNVGELVALIDGMRAEMSTNHFAALMNYVNERHSRSLRGIEEAQASAPGRFDDIAEMFLTWLVAARGVQGIQLATDAFVQFSTDVNLAQARYEEEGSYQNKSFADVYADHYSQNETMSGYLWGIYLTNFLWAHHTRICLFYRDQFLSRLSDSAQLVEIAPGHGGWGSWALNVLPQARLDGFDISPQSMEIANSVARAAGVSDRAKYVERDALDLAQMPAAFADAVICSFLVEHLEKPEKLFAVISHLLKPRGIGFVTGALTAAQVDHIYEFRYESELVKMCEDHGLRVLATLSANPARTLPKAKYMPRSMALLVQKRINDIY